MCHICVIQIKEKPLSYIKTVDMAHYKFMLLEYNAGKDGKIAVTLRITKDRKRK